MPAADATARKPQLGVLGRISLVLDVLDLAQKTRSSCVWLWYCDRIRVPTFQVDTAIRGRKFRQHHLYTVSFRTSQKRLFELSLTCGEVQQFASSVLDSAVVLF